MDLYSPGIFENLLFKQPYKVDFLGTSAVKTSNVFKALTRTHNTWVCKQQWNIWVGNGSLEESLGEEKDYLFLKGCLLHISFKKFSMWKRRGHMFISCPWDIHLIFLVKKPIFHEIPPKPNRWVELLIVRRLVSTMMIFKKSHRQTNKNSHKRSFVWSWISLDPGSKLHDDVQ